MKSGKYTVDRTENGIVILAGCDDGAEIEIPAVTADCTLNDGDIVYVSFDSNGCVSGIKADKQETNRKKKAIAEKLRMLFCNKTEDEND